MRVSFVAALALVTLCGAYTNLADITTWEGTVPGKLYKSPDGTYTNTIPYQIPALSGGAKVAIVSMSNGNQEWSKTLQNTSWNHYRTVNLAQGGKDITLMDQPTESYWTIAEERLALAGESYGNINVVIFKNFFTQENMMSYGNFPEDSNNAVDALCADYKTALTTWKGKFYNAKRFLFQSRSYAGHLGLAAPRWFETSFAIRCAINEWNTVTGPADANGLYPTTAPVVYWFNDLYDNTMTVADYEGPTNVHPNAQGEAKLALKNLAAAKAGIGFDYAYNLVVLKPEVPLAKVKTFSWDISGYPNGGRRRRVQILVDADVGTGTCTITRSGLPNKVMQPYPRGDIIMIDMQTTITTGSISCGINSLVSWMVVGML